MSNADEGHSREEDLEGIAAKYAFDVACQMEINRIQGKNDPSLEILYAQIGAALGQELPEPVVMVSKLYHYMKNDPQGQEWSR